MKLSAHARKILENYATIQSALIIKKTPEGQDSTTIMTCTRNRTVIASAKVDDVFPTNITIKDLKTFLSTLSALGDDAEITFAEDEENDSPYLIMSGNNASVKLLFGDMDTVIKPPASLAIPDVDFKFELKQEDFAKVLNFSNILNLPSFRIYNKKKKLFIQAVDRETPNSNTFEIQVGEVHEAENISVFIQKENLKMIPGNYTVGVKLGRGAILTNADDPDLVYVVALVVAS